MFLLIDRNADQFYSCETLKDAAKRCEADSSDLHHQIKGTGRWDSQDLAFTVIPNLPDWATETD